jgi:hypothetical protein
VVAGDCWGCLRLAVPHQWHFPVQSCRPTGSRACTFPTGRTPHGPGNLPADEPVPPGPGHMSATTWHRTREQKGCGAERTCVLFDPSTALLLRKRTCNSSANAPFFFAVCKILTFSAYIPVKATHPYLNTHNAGGNPVRGKDHVGHAVRVVPVSAANPPPRRDEEEDTGAPVSSAKGGDDSA